jgi:hypothetical protein
MIFSVNGIPTLRVRLYNKAGTEIAISKNIMSAIALVFSEIKSAHFSFGGHRCAIYRSDTETPFCVVQGYYKIFVRIVCDTVEITKFSTDDDTGPANLLTLNKDAVALFPLRELHMRSKHTRGATALVTNRFMKIIKYTKMLGATGMSGIVVKTDDGNYILHDQGLLIVAYRDNGEIFAWKLGDASRKVSEEEFFHMCNEDDDVDEPARPASQELDEFM